MGITYWFALYLGVFYVKWLFFWLFAVSPHQDAREQRIRGKFFNETTQSLETEVNTAEPP